jgi:Na+/H+-translocating membrane pyrophosphatase
MKAVGTAAMEMVLEVQDQFDRNPGLLVEGTTERPDYQRCIAISTRAALRYMIAPGALVMLAPLIAGTFCGVYAVCGLLTGGLVSAVNCAISQSNSGGAWDNCKKYIEKAAPGSDLQGKGSEIHKAAVVGDTVGGMCGGRIRNYYIPSLQAAVFSSGFPPLTCRSPQGYERSKS